MSDQLTLEHVRAAHARIRDSIVATPTLHSQTLSKLTGANIYLKFENHQFTAAYKERGALNAILLLTEEQRSKGVIAASAGNHAQGLSYHGTRLGIPVTIVMPVPTPTVKVMQTESVGGKVVLDAARRGEPLAGVASFHGALVTATPATPNSVKTRVLVEHGASDSMVTPEQVAAFKQEMDAAGASYEFVSIEGAKHGFTNPDADRLSHGGHGGPDIGYNKAADEKSWADMKAFLQKIFS